MRWRTHDLKAACHFMDADVVGIAPLEAGDGGHACALVILVEHGRLPEADNLAYGWSADGRAAAATLRAGEIALVAAGYIRQLGWPARAHFGMASEVDLARLAVRAGVALINDGRLVNPFVGAQFALAAVTTSYPLRSDRPLAASARNGARTLGHWLGSGGSEPALERWRRRRRTDLSPYPMERIRRVEEPTTLIHEGEIPRVPKRAAFFERALRGDLGPKAQAERMRFATKHPFAAAMTPLIAGMVSHQDGEVAPGARP